MFNVQCVNDLFVDAVHKSFSEATRSSIREYCGYRLKFAPDRMGAAKRSLSFIENVIDMGNASRQVDLSLF